MKKPTIKSLQAELATARELNEYLRGTEARLRSELEVAKRSAQRQIDQSLINERQRMMNSLSQLVDAVSKAVVWTVGKEQL